MSRKKIDEMREVVLEYLISECLEEFDDMDIDTIEELYYNIFEGAEEQRKRELRAHSLENKRRKEVESNVQGTKKYLKSFKGFVTSQKAQRYYAGRPAPSDVTSSEKERKGYRAPKSRI